MLGSVALDVTIGLVFIYLLYSLLATILQEIIATYFSFRAKNLEKAITRMLEDGSNNKNILGAFYGHPIIKFLGEDEKNDKKPAYIKAETFSKVMIDLLKGNDATAMQPGIDIRPLIQQSIDSGLIQWKKIAPKLNDPALSNKIEEETLVYLRSIWAEAQGDVDKFKALLESWFNETMDRASGWYKKRVQRILFFIGFAIAVIFNVNTIKIAQKLAKDPDLRAQVVAQADAFMKAHPNLGKELEAKKMANENLVKQQATANDSTVKDTTTASAKAPVLNSQQKLELKKLDSLDQVQYRKDSVRRDTLSKQANELIQHDIKSLNTTLGLGWHIPHLHMPACSDWGCRIKYISLQMLHLLLWLIGWLITALAISLGAPFWFDLLNKLMQLRSSMSTTDSAAKEQKVKEAQQAAKNRKG